MIIEFDDNKIEIPDRSGCLIILCGQDDCSTMLALSKIHKRIPNDFPVILFENPESNLHPSEQRRKAREIALLANDGSVVLLRTHSDYLIKELNILIMLNGKQKHLKTIEKAFGYTPYDLLLPRAVRAYEVVNDNGKSLLIEQEVDPEVGIFMKSFDKENEEMNSIQRQAAFGLRQGKKEESCQGN